MSEISFGSDILDGRYVHIPIIRRVDGGDTDPDKRILYRYNPNIPDNKSSPDFLSSLSLDVNLGAYEYFPTVKTTAVALCLHSCTLPCFVLVFREFSVAGEVSISGIVIVSTLMLVAGYLCREKLVEKALAEKTNIRPRMGKGRKFLRDISRGILLFASLFVISPMIKTLTKSWESKTIVSFGTVVFLLHVVFHDYEFIVRGRSRMDQWYIEKGTKKRVVDKWKQVDNPVALNAVILSAIILGSQFGTSEYVFAFMFFSISSFAYFPFVLKWIRRESSSVFERFIVPSIVFAMASILVAHVGTVACAAYLTMYSVIVFGGPALLIVCLPLKRSIKGPWDIAHVKERVIIETPVMLATVPAGIHEVQTNN
jgi:hypothetical protein